MQCFFGIKDAHFYTNRHVLNASHNWHTKQEKNIVMTIQKEEPNFFFDVRTAKSLNDLYDRMRVITKSSEPIDWRSMDPRDYLFDDDCDEETFEMSGDGFTSDKSTE